MIERAGPITAHPAVIGRQLNDNAGTRVAVGHGDRPAVDGHDLHHDGQTQPGAPRGTVPRGVEAGEPLEDPLPLVGRIPGPSSATTSSTHSR